MFKKLLSVILMVGLLGGSVFAIKNLGTVQRYTQDFAPFTARDVPDMQAVMDYADSLQETGMWIKTGTSIFYTGDNVGIGTNNPQAKLDVLGNKVMFGRNNTYSTGPQVYDMAVFGRQNHVEKGFYSAAIGYNNTFSGGIGSPTSASLVVGRDNIIRNSSTSLIAGKGNNVYSQYSNTLGGGNGVGGFYTNVLGRANTLGQNSQLATVIGFSNEISVSSPPNPQGQYIFGGYNTITGGTDEQMILGWNGEMSGGYSMLLNASQDNYYVTGDSKIVLNANNGVGINTVSPTRTLEVGGDAIIQTGLIVGEGTLNNVGFVMGNNCIAGGQYSMAVGNTNQALGDNSVSLGRNNISNSNRAITIGKNNSDSNSVSYDSIMIGYGNHVSSSSDFILGYGNVDLGRGNTTVGRSNQVNGRNGTTLGYFNTFDSQAYGNVTVGYSNIVNGYNNTLLGHGLVSSGTSSSPQQTLLGKFNEKIGGDVVVIGGGTSDGDRRNAITITGKRIGVGKNNPNRALEISGITRSDSFELLGPLGESFANTFSGIIGGVAIGQENYVEGYGVAVGHRNSLYRVSNQSESIVIGERNTLTGTRGFVQGLNNKLETFYSQGTMFGTANKGSGEDLFVVGYTNEINGDGIIAIGNNLTGADEGKIILGDYNVDVDDTALIVGAGDSGTRINAMVIEDGGQIGIGTDTPDTQLQVNGHIRPETDGQDLGKSSTELRWDANLRTVNFVSMYGAVNGRFRMPLATSDPIFPQDGMMYYNTSTDKLRLRANGAWVNIN